MQIPLDGPLFRAAVKVAALYSVSVEELILSWVKDGLLAHGVQPEEIAATDPSSRKCLVPHCAGGDHTRGLCTKHYQQARFYVKNKGMPETQLVRTGKMFPAYGKSISSYAFLALPASKIPPPPNSKPETLWFWNRS